MYAHGTLVCTADGERPIETLTPASEVLTVAGAMATVVWLGKRRVSCGRYRRPRDVSPVRVAAGAFGPGTPHTDLLLSPEHGLFVDGVLIPVRHLVNGTSVSQLSLPDIEYWHLELDRHAIVQANGLPAESWLDTGSRSMFTNAAIADLRFSERRPSRPAWAERLCAPVVTSGPVVNAVRRRLAGPAADANATDGVRRRRKADPSRSPG